MVGSMGHTAGVIFGGAKANSPGGHPLLRDAAVIGTTILGGLLLNKAINPKPATPPAQTTLIAPTNPAPPKLMAPPDLMKASGTPKKSGRNATILTGANGLGTISQSNVQSKTLLGM